MFKIQVEHNVRKILGYMERVGKGKRKKFYQPETSVVI